jgi:hypothetical protein
MEDSGDNCQDTDAGMSASIGWESSDPFVTVSASASVKYSSLPLGAIVGFDAQLSLSDGTTKSIIDEIEFAADPAFEIVKRDDLGCDATVSADESNSGQLDTDAALALSASSPVATTRAAACELLKTYPVGIRVKAQGQQKLSFSTRSGTGSVSFEVGEPELLSIALTSMAVTDDRCFSVGNQFADGSTAIFDEPANKIDADSTHDVNVYACYTDGAHKLAKDEFFVTQKTNNGSLLAPTVSADGTVTVHAMSKAGQDTLRVEVGSHALESTIYVE